VDESPAQQGGLLRELSRDAKDGLDEGLFFGLVAGFVLTWTGIIVVALVDGARRFSAWRRRRQLR
jgi:hypothetical protein